MRRLPMHRLNTQRELMHRLLLRMLTFGALFLYSAISVLAKSCGRVEFRKAHAGDGQGAFTLPEKSGPAPGTLSPYR